MFVCGAARRRPARARARGARLRAARARARLAARRCSSRRSGWRRCARRGDAADAARARRRSSSTLDWARFPLWLVALAAGAARVRGARRRDRRPRARGARRLAARVPAVAAARVPRARAERRGLRRPLRRDPRRLGAVPVQAGAAGARRGAQRRRPGHSARPARAPGRAGGRLPRSRGSRCGASAEDVEERGEDEGARSATSASIAFRDGVCRDRASRCWCWVARGAGRGRRPARDTRSRSSAPQAVSDFSPASP